MLSFGPGDFYMVQIIKRRRENPAMPKGSVIIKTFYIESFEEYDKMTPRIIEICDFDVARAYIRLNKRNYKSLALKMIKRIADLMTNNNEHALKNLFDSIAGENHSDPNKKWLVDVDWKEFNVNTIPMLAGGEIIGTSGMNELVELISDLTEMQGGKKWEPMIITIPTKNGCHIITYPFNMEKFVKKYPKAMVHKEDATTLMYCP